ncbi:MAG TPA: enoyl-CoA hydratase-related protein [Thermodesulfobacteriota bacterium]|jgi:enoyl-CoA hydratase
MKKISYAIENNRAVITMDDGKANAMDFDYFEEMNKALAEVESAGSKAVIIKGRQGFFSGGLDVKLIATLAPTDLDRLAETFARTMLRVFLYPIPTVAVCTGHAIAGGAMLAFACDRRYVIEGNYRIQMNELVIGIPLPSWMLLIGKSAIPVGVQTEVLLHAKAYTPKEVCDAGIFHGLIDSGADIDASLNNAVDALMGLQRKAYSTTKRWLREKAVKEVLAILKDELPSK